MGLTEFNGGVVDALNGLDQCTEDLLEQTITAANATANVNSDVTFDPKLAESENWSTQEINEHGGIEYGGKMASLSGTGGVALLEYAKNAIETAVSSVSSTGTAWIKNAQVVKQKMNQIG